MVVNYSILFFSLFLVNGSHDVTTTAFKPFIHIGPHKTGSTGLQMDLMNNEQYLKKHKYQLIGSSYTHKGGAFVANSLSGPEQALSAYYFNKTTFRIMVKDIAPCSQNIILSTEELIVAY